MWCLVQGDSVFGDGLIKEIRISSLKFLIIASLP
jgi:hypothetical protein